MRSLPPTLDLLCTTTQWLESSDDLPPKLKSLMPINNILAHQPWLLGPEDIGALIKSGVDYWSLNELTQAITIMAHFHAGPI